MPDDPEECYSHAFHLDLMRGIKRQNFWIMEQLSGGMGCWMPMKPMPEPGMIEGYSLQAFAHGADTVVHFRWRTAVSGAEMFWHGLIDHSNVPGRRFAEFAHLCETAKELDEIEGTVINAPAAILYSSDNEYALGIQPQTDGMYYLEQMKLFHDAFTSCGINVDIIGAHEELEGYRVVVAPQLYITDETLAARLYAFAEKGGTVILTNRSGVKDPYNKCLMEPLPTVYRKLAGAYVEEYNPIGSGTSKVKFADGTVFDGRQWCDILQTETAETVASYDSDFYSGKAAITANSYGKGRAYYVGTVGTKGLYRKLIRMILQEAEVPYVEGLPENVEITTREGAGKEVQFIFNNTDKEQEFVLQGERISLCPFEMKIRKIHEK
jgi:beta-galactosidase